MYTNPLLGMIRSIVWLNTLNLLWSTMVKLCLQIMGQLIKDQPNAHKLFVHTSDLGWQEEEQRSHMNNLCESRHYRKSRNFHFNFVVERKNEKYKRELIID